MAVKLWLSDLAWDMLSREAISLGWTRTINTVHMPGVTTRGIGRFFAALGTLDYEDTRPEQFEGTAIWQQGERTRRRLITMPYDELTYLAATAIKHRIPPGWLGNLMLNERVSAVAMSTDTYASVLANNHTTLPGLAAATLEAIGCQYLTPAVFPAAPADRYTRTPKTAGRGRRIDFAIP